METYDAIYKRRSIRKYKISDIPDDVIEKILLAGLQAPSSKNKQPWKFVVTKGESKDEALRVMESGIEKAKCGQGLLPKRQHLIPSVENTLKIMRQSPVVVFVFNTGEHHLFDAAETEEKFVEVSAVLSIGAAIENMLLMAADLGIGSLWICDTVFAYNELCVHFNENNQLISAISFGYADEEAKVIPKKDAETVIEWR